MKENKKVKEAIEKVDDFMSEDEKRELAELREKWQMDYDSSISYATKKGRLEERLHIAKKMLDKNSDLQEIIELTGLDETEILKLKYTKNKNEILCKNIDSFVE